MDQKDSPPPPNKDERRPSTPARGDGPFPRWALWIVAGVLAVLVVSTLFSPSGNETELTYGEFLQAVENGDVDSVEYDNNNGKITGQFKDEEEFRTTGFLEGFPASDRALLDENGVQIEAKTPKPSIFLSILPIFLPMLLIVGVLVWIARRQQSQMGGIMSVGRSKAKTYTTERPGTTFDDVAGYAGVKQEVTEVVDFLKHPNKFNEIGARIPKGVLLVGPPGTGKTLIARAVAGEAGVPFMSVTGSDFMEMFVGVGASRVRDLFNEARKMGRAIIFVDEIDSIGRKRGAGLGGGHDEREQTLNQMLAEMDGFETTAGIGVGAATNRPYILDPALLRPGRVDRQVVVPLPELEDRRQILEVHIKHKKVAEDVDLGVVARGTPGMSGADLANLINEAALHAVRAGENRIHASHIDAARDRVLMGQKRESMALSDEEKEAIAYHEGGHAVCAAVLPHADPLHKVTIIPSGMALGVTMQLPDREQHIYRRNYIEDRLVVMFGGRIAEELVFGMSSTGAANDLLQATNMARKMVAEWGMSEQVGPMAWGADKPIFLGDDMMQTREYSEHTARVLDQESQRILLEQEERCRALLDTHRHGLDLVARALLEHETISGAEVHRLLDLASQETGETPPVDVEPIEVDIEG